MAEIQPKLPQLSVIFWHLLTRDTPGKETVGKTSRTAQTAGVGGNFFKSNLGVSVIWILLKACPSLRSIKVVWVHHWCYVPLLRHGGLRNASFLLLFPRLSQHIPCDVTPYSTDTLTVPSFPCHRYVMAIALWKAKIKFLQDPKHLVCWRVDISTKFSSSRLLCKRWMAAGSSALHIWDERCCAWVGCSRHAADPRDRCQFYKQKIQPVSYAEVF